jgi:hypothetical protein
MDVDENSTIKRVSEGFDIFFTVAFTIESIIKVISFGFIMD